MIKDCFLNNKKVIIINFFLIIHYLYLVLILEVLDLFYLINIILKSNKLKLINFLIIENENNLL